ncbi:MAG TPA: hypothetical protein VHZ95_01635, partial [Polyangiales bacterium]|nr:hypothetical protein [Polyangiales bacterium]
AFAWLMQKCEGFVGYLFVPNIQPSSSAFASNVDAPSLIESNDEREPPAPVIELAKRGLGSMSMEDVTTHCGPVELNTQAERPASKREVTAEPTEILHVHLLSFVDAERFCGEAALVLRGARTRPPRLRYDLLQVAAKHLHRVRAIAPVRVLRSTPPTSDQSATA